MREMLACHESDDFLLEKPQINQRSSTPLGVLALCRGEKFLRKPSAGEKNNFRKFSLVTEKET